MGRKIFTVVVVLFLSFSAIGMTEKQKKQDNACLYIIDEIFWGYPDDSLTIRVFSDKVQVDYVRSFNGQELMAPIVIFNEDLSIKVDNELFCFNEKSGTSDVSEVKYDGNSNCIKVWWELMRPGLLCVQKENSMEKAYLLDPLGIGIHHGIWTKGTVFYDCYKGIPDGWRRVVDLICQVRLSIENNLKDIVDKETRMFNKKFRKYWEPKEYGVVDAKFLTFLYKDKKITGIAFRDIAKILKRRKDILNEALPLIDKYNELLPRDDIFLKMKKIQYDDSFEELETLVGLKNDP